VQPYILHDMKVEESIAFFIDLNVRGAPCFADAAISDDGMEK